MADNQKSAPSNKNISISGDVVDSTVFIGDNNTIIQKFFNIFKSDASRFASPNVLTMIGRIIGLP